MKSYSSTLETKLSSTVKRCHVCGSGKLRLLRPIELVDGTIIDSSVLCKTCNTIHYMEDGNLNYDIIL